MDEQIPQSDVPNTPRQTSSLAVPIAIVFGFALVAVAIFFNGKQTQETVIAPTGSDSQQEVPVTGTATPVNDSDHIRGNPNAPIVIVEYSDFDCPFCKNFHETMNRIMDEYGTSGKVAWVYRQFPLQQLHPSAPYIAAASECVAQLGGNEAFWKFADLVFEERGVNEPTNTARLPDFAVAAGVDETAYNACVADGNTKSLVEEDFDGGVRAGAKGTPYSLVMIGDQQFVINGAQPYDYVSQAIDTLLEQIEGSNVEPLEIE